MSIIQHTHTHTFISFANCDVCTNCSLQSFVFNRLRLVLRRTSLPCITFESCNTTDLVLSSDPTGVLTRTSGTLTQTLFIDCRRCSFRRASPLTINFVELSLCVFV